MNEKKIPFKISRGNWGNLSISVDRIENIRYSSKSWYCDAFTLSEEYKDYGYGKLGDFKVIGCAGCYQFKFSDDEKLYREEFLPEIKKHHEKGLKYQKAGKDYNCFYCKKLISKGTEYEKYGMRSAGENNMMINENYCLGHRDEMREIYFKKSMDKISFQELIETWNKGIII